MYGLDGFNQTLVNIGTVWGAALPPNKTDFSGMTNEYVGACIQTFNNYPPVPAYWTTNWDWPCKCQQVFISNALSQMTCMVSFPSIGRQSVGVMQTQVCTAIHNVTMRL